MVTVNALACLIRYPQFSDDWLLPGRKKTAISNSDHRRALNWYSKSLYSLQQRISQGSISPAMLMVTCLLYTCVECLQDNLEEAIVIYQRAMAMTGTLTGDGKVFGAVGKREISLERTTRALLRHMSISQALPVSWYKLEGYPDLDFNSFSQAREYGYILLAAIHRFVCHAQDIKMTKNKDWLPTEELVHARDDLKTKLQQWEATLHDLARNRSVHVLDSAEEDEHYSALLVSCIHIFVFLSTSLSMYETSFDDFLPQFRSIIRYARRHVAAQRARSQCPVFVFETRIIPALHYLALKCRHPLIRRESLFLLENEVPRMEYYFKAEAMAKVARRHIAIEEAGGNELGIFHPQCPPKRHDVLPVEQHRIYRGHAINLPDPSSGEPAQYLSYSIWRQHSEDRAWTPSDHVVKM